MNSSLYGLVDSILYTSDTVDKLENVLGYRGDVFYLKGSVNDLSNLLLMHLYICCFTSCWGCSL